MSTPTKEAILEAMSRMFMRDGSPATFEVSEANWHILAAGTDAEFGGKMPDAWGVPVVMDPHEEGIRLICHAPEKPATPPPLASTCNTEDAAVALIRQRGVIGRQTYGQTMDRSDLPPIQWARHFQEEMADGLQYGIRVEGACQLLEEARAIMQSLATERGWDVCEQWLARYDAQFPKPKA